MLIISFIKKILMKNYKYCLNPVIINAKKIL